MKFTINVLWRDEADKMKLVDKVEESDCVVNAIEKLMEEIKAEGCSADCHISLIVKRVEE